MGVTIRQIAEKAGVSRGTVDRALNNRDGIRPEVAERIRKIADDMGYIPNRLGRALSMSKNNIKIGVILQPSSTPFMKSVLKGIESAKEEINGLGSHVIICKLPFLNEKDTIEAMEYLRYEGVSAIAMVPIDSDVIRDIIDTFIENYHIPVVTFNSDVKDTKRLCFVGQNAFQCGRAAARLMGDIVGGRGKVAIISGYSSNTSHGNRVRGFCEEIKGKYKDIEIIGPEYCFEDTSAAGQITEKLIEIHPDIKGIYITSHGEDGVCNVLKRHKLTGSIKMIANDFMGNNYELMRQGQIDFLIGQDAHIQGYEPVMILFRLLFNGEMPKNELQYTEIFIRNEYTIPEVM